MSENKETLVRELRGRVVSDKNDKTVTVLVERRVKHPIYGKFITRSTRLAAHDESNQAQEGDIVTIVPCKPMSRSKRWAVNSVVDKA
jgi:small subunit ribosomal protein S17